MTHYTVEQIMVESLKNQMEGINMHFKMHLMRKSLSTARFLVFETKSKMPKDTEKSEKTYLPVYVMFEIT